MTQRPLCGIKVVELARVLAGPWAGQTLADLGAEVIKVERPGGDETRAWGPPFVENGDGTRDAAYFHATNRGKQSIVADFNDAADLSRVRALIAEADVLIENFRVGSLARFGLDYPTIAKLNPRLVYCSITGFGQTGPHAALAGYDFVIQGISGIMDLTGDPGGAPQKMGVAFADIMTGLYGVIAIQAALAQRQTTGAGQHIDMALLDVMVGVLANQGLNYLVSGTSPTRLGNAHPNIAPYEAFPTSDGWIILAVGSNHQFQKFCSVIGMPELERDARFASNAQRLAHLEELRARITAQTRLWQRDALLERLAAACVPAGPINNVEQAYAHPQVRHRAMTTTMQRSSDGVSVPVIRLPITASGMALGAGEPSPRLGNHAGCGQPGPTLVEDAATGGARR